MIDKLNEKLSGNFGATLFVVLLVIGYPVGFWIGDYIYFLIAGHSILQVSN